MWSDPERTQRRVKSPPIPECKHDHLLVICDQQVVVRLRQIWTEEHPGPLWEYEQTVINDRVAPFVIRTVCENCAETLHPKDAQAWLRRQNRKRWRWTFSSFLDTERAIRKLRELYRELTK